MFYEIRTEHPRTGRGADLVHYMDEIVVPLHRAMGMDVLGTFTAAGDDEAFVWIRRFEDDTERTRVLDAVHQHPRFAGVAATVSTLVARSGSTVRLDPAPGSRLR
ncbi:hypothetical protein ACFQHV_02390 [Promicromonospora thailandica]|uniref:NIPSNAP protein n=1 Tax=Promicromonospora thailandica TaxID=765201 RepID=A0A9X2G3U3_9MICO|nr:hypothetical protein [Promicromonospora thailandica]MCP2265295.1 NIPSNAP protein [Promicromonospora thailandica]BFF16820.1 NIPSNAP family protein [Promicromonospora thailandica]